MTFLMGNRLVAAHTHQMATFRIGSAAILHLRAWTMSTQIPYPRYTAKVYSLKGILSTGAILEHYTLSLYLEHQASSPSRPP